VTIGVKTSVVGLERFATRMTNRANFLGSGMKPLLREAGDELIETYKERIESFTPGEVPDLKDSTKKQKAKQVGFVYPILVRTRTMIDSMYARVKSAVRGSGWGIAIGFSGSQKGVSNARIAQIHITGEGNMPMRDFTKVPASFSDSIFRRIRDALRRA
jgi:hypothetical protein